MNKIVTPSPAIDFRLLTFLIDPGHGGIDSGARAKSGQTEARTNLNVCTYLQAELAFLGAHVDMTRTRHEESVTINQRMAMIRKKKYDFVISVHHNGGGGDGAEICVQIANANATYDEKSTKLAGFVLKEFEMLGQNIRKKPLLQIVNSTGDADKLGVLRAAAEMKTVGIVSEMGFMDSPDVQAFDTFTEQKAEAHAFVLGIKEYLKSIA